MTVFLNPLEPSENGVFIKLIIAFEKERVAATFIGMIHSPDERTGPISLVADSSVVDGRCGCSAQYFQAWLGTLGEFEVSVRDLE